MPSIGEYIGAYQAGAGNVSDAYRLRLAMQEMARRQALEDRELFAERSARTYNAGRYSRMVPQTPENYGAWSQTYDAFMGMPSGMQSEELGRIEQEQRKKERYDNFMRKKDAYVAELRSMGYMREAEKIEEAVDFYDADALAHTSLYADAIAALRRPEFSPDEYDRELGLVGDEGGGMMMPGEDPTMGPPAPDAGPMMLPEGPPAPGMAGMGLRGAPGPMAGLEPGIRRDLSLVGRASGERPSASNVVSLMGQAERAKGKPPRVQLTAKQVKDAHPSYTDAAARSVAELWNTGVLNTFPLEGIGSADKGAPDRRPKVEAERLLIDAQTELDLADDDAKKLAAETMPTEIAKKGGKAADQWEAEHEARVNQAERNVRELKLIVAEAKKQVSRSALGAAGGMEEDDGEYSEEDLDAMLERMSDQEYERVTGMKRTKKRTPATRGGVPSE